MDEIDNKIAKGAAWMVSFKMIDRGLGLVSTVILARLLVPEDFGLVAMAMILIGALQLLMAFSFDVPLIQNRNAGRDQFDTAWTLNVIFASACAAILASVAGLAARFYQEPRLELVIYLLAVGFAVEGFSNIGPVIFRREMQFDREFKFLLGKRMASLLVTIPLAFWWRNYWALVAGQLTGTFVSVALSYYVSDYRPRFSLKAKVELFHSSKWLVMNNILQFLNGRASELLIGRLGGATTLGVYTIASEISTLPTTELVAPINRAAFPGYARVANDLEALRNSFLGVISMIALFALPAGVGIATIADLMVPVVLGWKWVPAIPLIQILAIYGVIQALQSNISYVYLATGRLYYVTAVGAIQFTLLISLLIPGILYKGATGAAWAFLGTVVLITPVIQYLVAKRLQLSSTAFLARLARPLAAVLIMAAVVLAMKHVLHRNDETSSYLVALVLCVAGGALAYSVSLYVLWRWAGSPHSAERVCLGKIETLLQRAGLKVSLT
ncbi:lipopolysaccharide biosynthesis protein [Noviherbaspirillum sp. ST9]|uniref:lipopolysaccharide biosynthesis protein n=1 Tax=Noviherbaspirillum sp. ST9 TaxID=3401606 RepID=UPI003B588F3A